MASASTTIFALEEIIRHLGAAVMQHAPSDDAIIADHIVCALAHAKAARASLAGDSQPMRCYWCGEVHFGGQNNCGRAAAKPARTQDGEPLDPMRGVEFPFAENH